MLCPLQRTFIGYFQGVWEEKYVAKNVISCSFSLQFQQFPEKSVGELS